MTRQLWCVPRISKTRLADYLGALFPAVSSTALMSLAVLALRAGMRVRTAASLRLVYEIAIGAAAYAASLLVFHSRRVRAALAFIRLRDSISASVASRSSSVLTSSLTNEAS
jgi:hypothetical protein